MQIEQYEKMAMEKTLRDLGSYVADVGMEKPLAEYSKDQILGMIKVCVFHTRHHLSEILALNDAVPM